MKPFNSADNEIAEEIEIRQRKLRNIIDLANQKMDSGQTDEAIDLFSKAQNLSLYVRDGLQVRVLNEQADNELWNELKRKIESLIAVS
ncbi:MAG: hypothetical protein WAW86_02300 [Gammaproteobacteria bacterium]